MENSFTPNQQPTINMTTLPSTPDAPLASTPPPPSSVADQTVSTQQNSKRLWIFLTFIVIVVLFVAGVYVFTQNSDSAQTSSVQNSPPTPTAFPVEPTNLVENTTGSAENMSYTNQQYDYSINYPEAWSVNTDSELNGDYMIGTLSIVSFWPPQADTEGEGYKRGVVVDVYPCKDNQCDNQDAYIESFKASFNPSTAIDQYEKEFNSSVTEDFESYFQTEKLSVNGYPAVRTESTPTNSERQFRMVAVLSAPYLYVISTNNVDPADRQYYSVFYQMASSFTLNK